jgi:hypothetical protein
MLSQVLAVQAGDLAEPLGRGFEDEK